MYEKLASLANYRTWKTTWKVKSLLFGICVRANLQDLAVFETTELRAVKLKFFSYLARGQSEALKKFMLFRPHWAFGTAFYQSAATITSIIILVFHVRKTWLHRTSMCIDMYLSYDVGHGNEPFWDISLAEHILS